MFQRAGLYHHYRNRIDIPTANTSSSLNVRITSVWRLHQCAAASDVRIIRHMPVADAASKSDTTGCTKTSWKRLLAGRSRCSLRWHRTIWRFAARVNCLAKTKAAQWKPSASAPYRVAGNAVDTQKRLPSLPGRSHQPQTDRAADASLLPDDFILT